MMHFGFWVVDLPSLVKWTFARIFRCGMQISSLLSLASYNLFMLSVERLWSPRDATSTGNMNVTVLPRLEYFRCLLNQRGVPAAPVTNNYARRPPIGPGSCYMQ